MESHTRYKFAPRAGRCSAPFLLAFHSGSGALRRGAEPPGEHWISQTANAEGYRRIHLRWDGECVRREMSSWRIGAHYKKSGIRRSWPWISASSQSESRPLLTHCHRLRCTHARTHAPARMQMCTARPSELRFANLSPVMQTHTHSHS